MENTRRIERSRRIYSRLLFLYPKEHREAYGQSMLQVFTDQLRETSQAGEGAHFLALWLRTLWDLGISSLKEQFSSAHLTAGLLEAVPNTPLPWKGVALVMVPGLAFFIAQLVQLTGQDWFYWMTYRAGYFLIVPVLIVWAWKRKFPIWGLVPLGLFFHTAWNFGYRVIMGQFFLGHIPWFTWLDWEGRTAIVMRFVCIALAGLLALALLVILVRRRRIQRGAWIWLAIFAVLSLLVVGVNYLDYFYYNPFSVQLSQFVAEMVPFYISDSAGLLILILLGAFFTRRHGRLTMLLVMGYLLPTIVYGRFTNFWSGLSDQVVSTYLLLISFTVLFYRVIIALIAPLWVVRSASESAQRKASLTTLLISVGIQAAMNIGVGVFMALYYQYTGWHWVNWYNTIAPQLVAAAGIGLAAQLFGNEPLTAEDSLWPNSNEVSLASARE